MSVGNHEPALAWWNMPHLWKSADFHQLLGIVPPRGGETFPPFPRLKHRRERWRRERLWSRCGYCC